MRRAVVVLVPIALALACAKAETPATDSSATAMAPAGLTEAQVAGTWTGTAKAESGDTTTIHWTQVCGGGTCRGTLQEMPGDTIVSTYSIEADSSVGVSTPYVDKMSGNVRVVDHWVARVSGSAISGRGWATLADKPDSVVSRYTFTGGK
ncbi:MAG: hypothetical protein IT361_18150 [Gemmatimonadaceae bacterium]|nr:hypothetical protein [Gemmatimonadaceae bacterium]